MRAEYGCHMQPYSPTAESAAGKSDPTLLADARALHTALSDLLRVCQFRDRERICCFDVSVTQCHALEALTHQGPMRSQALANLLLLDKSTTTRVVDALERKAYVQRLADPDDARALSLSITPAGRTLFETIHAGLIAQHAQLLADLDPLMRTRVTDVIRRLASAAQSLWVDGIGGDSSCVPSCTPGSSCG